MENLPDWAETSPPDESFDSPEQGGYTGGQGVSTKGHNDKDPVPVDSGIIWLFLAGIGYGVIRLKGEELKSLRSFLITGRA